MLRIEFHLITPSNGITLSDEIYIYRLGEVDRYANMNINKILVGNKCDLEDRRVVSFETAKVSFQSRFLRFPGIRGQFEYFLR